MNKVPKCKECMYLHQYIIGKHNYYDCYHPDNYKIGVKIYAKYIKTSPKRCKLRKDEYISD